MTFSRPKLAGREILIAVVISCAYLFFCYELIGLGGDHLVLTILCNVLYFASVGSRKFILGFFVFAVFWIIFDSMKVFPNYYFSEVHIKSLHDAELRFFGISVNNEIITPGKYLQLHQNTLLDILSGIFYLCWMPVPLAFAVYLFYTDRNQLLQFSLTFLLVNFIGFVIYYAYPAAAPWYVDLYGYEFNPHVRGNIAGLSRFDTLVGFPLFESIYTKSSNIFAAMPSLHSAYPLVVFFFALKNRMKVTSLVVGVVAAGIWLTAVYTDHHYVMDVLAGMICAVIGFILFSYFLSVNWIHVWFVKYLKAIE